MHMNALQSQSNTGYILEIRAMHTWQLKHSGIGVASWYFFILM